MICVSSFLLTAKRSRLKLYLFSFTQLMSYWKKTNEYEPGKIAFSNTDVWASNLSSNKLMFVALHI